VRRAVAGAAIDKGLPFVFYGITRLRIKLYGIILGIDVIGDTGIGIGVFIHYLTPSAPIGIKVNQQRLGLYFILFLCFFYGHPFDALGFLCLQCTQADPHTSDNRKKSYHSPKITKKCLKKCTEKEYSPER